MVYSIKSREAVPLSVDVSDLSSVEYMHLVKECPVKCPILRHKVRNLAEYFSVISSSISGRDVFWFRGHSDLSWTLTPSALRFKHQKERSRALNLISDFKRIAELKLTRPPATNDELRWVQLAQHYGVPTRLLDWTESATIALYFACEKTNSNGLVFILNPVDLNRLSYPKRPRVFDPQSDGNIINKYLSFSGRKVNRGPGTVALNPTWNSERLILQKGGFTLHGARFDLDQNQAPSLVAVPILKESKTHLREELGRVGVDEISIFPELEHSCQYLKRKMDLDQENR